MVCMYNTARRASIVSWQFNESTIIRRCCLNELKAKACVFNLPLCVDVVALKSRCAVFRRSPAIHE